MAAAIIIGAGPGLSASVARRVAGEDVPVSLISRTDGARRIAEEIRARGGLASALVGAVSDDGSLRSALDASIDAYGPPDLVVYNAAVIRLDAPGGLDRAGHLATWNVNVLGALATTAHLAPVLRVQGHGTIVLTGGMPRPDARYTSLSLGKAGLRAAARIIREDLEPPGIHVATVTIDCHLVPGTDSDPDLVAEHYWTLHMQPRGAWSGEIVHRGSTPV